MNLIELTCFLVVVTITHVAARLIAPSLLAAAVLQGLIIVVGFAIIGNIAKRHGKRRDEP
jgi:hypothetical protein